MKKDRYPLLIVFLCSLCLLIGLFIGRNTRNNSVMLSNNTQINATNPEESQANYRINVNTATSMQLQELPGIGDMLAKRIIDYRESYGFFQSIEDLLNVSGIGEKKLHEIEEFICVGG